MNDKLYLQLMKEKLNNDTNENEIFEESQTGPQEEPVILPYKVNVKKFKKYDQMKKKKRK